MRNFLSTWFPLPGRRSFCQSQLAPAVSSLECRQLLTAPVAVSAQAEKVQPHSIPPKDFSGTWNMTSDTFSKAKIVIQQIGHKSTAALTLGDVVFDVKAKVKGDQYVGKFKKTIADTRYIGKFDVSLLNPTTFVGSVELRNPGTPTNSYLVNGTHI